MFEYKDEDALGKVALVDTSRVVLKIANIVELRRLQVNRLIVLQSSKPGQHLIGIVQKIIRNATLAKSDSSRVDDAEPDEVYIAENTVHVILIGTFIAKDGTARNIFRRTLETVPEIDANGFALEGEALTDFMNTISQMGDNSQEKLVLGKYTIDEKSIAYLDANKLFQRHAVVVGSTGSGKSYTVARLIEQVANLPSANSILFDIHGEYKPLNGKGICHFKIAGPGDLNTGDSISSGLLHFPYWLLAYEDMMGMLIDRSDSNAPNQAMVFSRAVVNAKRAYLESLDGIDVAPYLDSFTIDSPIPYCLNDVLEEIKSLNSEMVDGSRSQKQGDFHGKLSRFIARLENKMADRRMGFMFNAPAETLDLGWLSMFAETLMFGTNKRLETTGGVKIVDFSEVPSDVLPLIVGRLASLVFTVQQWTKFEDRHPISLFCDEAHLYIPSSLSSISESALKYFERISKEGRKYGVGLVIVTQRPSEVSRTVLSQANNFISMRLTNHEDQSVIQRLLPDSLGGFTGILPILDVGEALVVGDCTLLPTRIRVDEPMSKPNSKTLAFWDMWSQEQESEPIRDAVLAWRQQSFS